MLQHAALERHAGQIGKTAEWLGTSRKNLWEKMRKLGFSLPAEPSP